MKGCANRRKKEEENLLLFNIMELIEEEDVFLGVGFP
jgi:hypothetical protein